MTTVPTVPDLEQLIVTALRGVAGDWNVLHVTIHANVRSFRDVKRTEPPATTAIVLPRPAVKLFRQLRDVMADPQRGAWYTVHTTVPRDGEASFDYDWMTKPDFGSAPLDDAFYIEDLERYPRAAANVPDWYQHLKAR